MATIPENMSKVSYFAVFLFFSLVVVDCRLSVVSFPGTGRSGFWSLNKLKTDNLTPEVS